MPGMAMLHTTEIPPALALGGSMPSVPQASHTQRRPTVHHSPYRRVQLTVRAVHVLRALGGTRAWCTYGLRSPHARVWKPLPPGECLHKDVLHPLLSSWNMRFLPLPTATWPLLRRGGALLFHVSAPQAVIQPKVSPRRAVYIYIFCFLCFSFWCKSVSCYVFYVVCLRVMAWVCVYVFYLFYV